MRNRSMGVAVALLLAACGQKPSHENEAPQQAAPDVAVTHVPGVSLTYSYAFRLPPEKLAAVQEAHAAQCEALTPARCRITGMSYEVHTDRTITGSLMFKLAPDIARAFGKKGVTTVSDDGGMLTQAAIDSEESGAIVDAAVRDYKDNGDERGRIEQQLARSGLPAAERTQLQERLVALSEQRQQILSARDGAQQKLANTPMTFAYISGQVDPGLNDGPLLGAVKDGWVNVVAGIAFLLMLAISLLPWIVAGAGLLTAWLFLQRRLAGWRRRDVSPPE